MSSTTDDQANDGDVIVDIPVAEANHHVTFFTACFFQCLGCICNLAATCDGLVTPLVRRLWANYNAQGAFWDQEGVSMPHSHYAIGFIITCLLGFAEIKSQGDSKFPFKTHPQAIMVYVTSLLVYGVVSAVELFILSSRVEPTSVYAVIARVGRIASLYVLVASLASLFYL